MPEAPIDKGLEIPPKKKAVVTSFGNPVDLNSTIDRLEPGDSFLVDEDWMRQRALMAGKQKSVNLTSRKQDGPEGKYRIWRTT